MMGEIFQCDFRKRRRANLMRLSTQITFHTWPIGSLPLTHQQHRGLTRLPTRLNDKGGQALCGWVSLRGLAKPRRPQATYSWPDRSLGDSGDLRTSPTWGKNETIHWNLFQSNDSSRHHLTIMLRSLSQGEHHQNLMYQVPEVRVGGHTQIPSRAPLF